MCFLMSDNVFFLQIFCMCLNVDEIFSWHNRMLCMSISVHKNFENLLTNKGLVKNIFE